MVLVNLVDYRFVSIGPLTNAWNL